MKKRNFIHREVFEEILNQLPRADGGHYEDIDTIYGDMSRFVVAYLSQANPEELREMYNHFGWGGVVNARAIHEAAKFWMTKYRPSVESRNEGKE